jgi:CubicO group peptidase (beta-lactamase class C family)
MPYKRFLVATLGVLLAAAVVVRADQVDDLIRAEMKRQNIPGLSLLVAKDGKIVKSAGYGFANLKLQVPATPETVYRIASVSKQFIATGIMLLVQDWQLKLDDPISKYLDETPSTWNAITIQHLLTHTSGLVREAPGFDPNKTQRDADVIKSAYRLPLHVSYFVLAEIISKVSGRPWTEYLNERVFKPSDMNTTHPTNAKLSVPNRAVGYSDNDKLLEARDWPALRPSGAFLSTVLDLAVAK